MAGNDISQLIKQAKKIQSKLEEIKSIQIEGSSCGGKVSIQISGDKDILKLSIDPSLLDDAEMTADAVIAAFNDASEKLEAEVSSKMHGINPSGIKLPF